MRSCRDVACRASCQVYCFASSGNGNNHAAKGAYIVIYNVNSTKSCRDAFLRLSKPPGLRKRQFHSAILLAETQECVSTR